MLATNKSLTKLDMSRCSIWGEGAVCLAKALEKNSSVTEFDIAIQLDQKVQLLLLVCLRRIRV